MLALAGLLAATVMVSGVAVAGLGAVDARTQELYQHNILTTEAIAELQATLDDAAGSALQLLLFEGTADRSRLLADLRGGSSRGSTRRSRSCRRPMALTPTPTRPGWNGSRRAGVTSSG
jgi:hypothetical protein